MVKIVPVTNTGIEPLYVGSSMVLPGDTRHFPLNEVPEHLRPKDLDAIRHGNEDVAVQTLQDPADAPAVLLPPPAHPLAHILDLPAEELRTELAKVDTIETIDALTDLELDRGDLKRKEVLDLLADAQFAIVEKIRALREQKAPVPGAKLPATTPMAGGLSTPAAQSGGERYLEILAMPLPELKAELASVKRLEALEEIAELEIAKGDQARDDYIAAISLAIDEHVKAHPAVQKST